MFCPHQSVPGSLAFAGVTASPLLQEGQRAGEEADQGSLVEGRAVRRKRFQSSCAQRRAIAADIDEGDHEPVLPVPVARRPHGKARGGHQKEAEEASSTGFVPSRILGAVSASLAQATSGLPSSGRDLRHLEAARHL